jgi:hypothetical protein
MLSPEEVEVEVDVCATIPIVAVALLLASAALTAVSVTSAGTGTAGGATYRPALETVPQALPVHPAPCRFHVTAVFDVPETAALNCWLPPVVTDALVGVTLTPVDATTVTFADAETVGSAALVAVILTKFEVGATSGAE